MLASRVLPPIPRPPSPPLPVATFFNVPRRYVRSNMQVGNEASTSPTDDVKTTTKHIRKSSKTNLTRSRSTPSHLKEWQTPTSDPDSPLQTRKRAASFGDDEGSGRDTDEADGPSEYPEPPSASSTGSGELAGHVCLCQPEPKIPRPRNAFILYRQHHQHNIVARNPGLANPEVSKIIGEQWKAESKDEKKVWQDLAQEEKARHHEQYPDYRYQPRRLGKPGSLPGNPSGQHTTVDKYRCSRCGGRNLKTPTSPFLSAAGTPTLPTLPPPVTSDHTPTTRYLPHNMSGLALDSPALRRRAPGPSSLSSIQVPASAVDPPYSPISPDSKRRRYNYGSVSNGRRADTPYYHSRRELLPPISQVRTSPPGTATMGPPRTPHSRKSSIHLNLLVPNQHDQSRSVEAMVMSVPYHVKIKVLGRITPPYKEPGPASPAIAIRGAILAVEGDDTAAVKELAEFLHDTFSNQQEYHARLAEPPAEPEPGRKDATFDDYLDLVKEWHVRSKEMVKFITTPVGSTPTSATFAPAPSPDDETRHSPSSATPPSPPLSTSGNNTKSPKPIVILPTYQLRASDVYASRIPIQDAYSPTDHWQWMATLWRGTVGPDLTIYVDSSEKKAEGGKLVELNEEGRTLTVRREKGGAGFDDSALRRVGFEVSEWVRGIGSK